MFGMDATSPKDVENALIEAKGEDLEVEINSGGGDVYAGSEIYTALKSYAGNVTVNIVGVAASAAGVIAMSGKKVLISPTAQLMMHNVALTASGDYRVMGHSAEVLKNFNTSIANAYILKTGMGQEELLALMDKETWLNAQRAVELGFADEVMFDEGNQLVASANSFMFPPKVIDKMRNLFKNQTGMEAGLNFAQNTKLPQEPAQKPQTVNQKEDESVEIKNVDELKQHFPDLVAQVEAAARDDGSKNERERIKAIDEIGKTVDPALVNKAKYDEPMTAQDLAFAALKADAGKGRQYLEDVSNDNGGSGVKGVSGQPGGPKPEKEKEMEERKNNAQAIADFANKRRSK